jgi:anaerobic selenocysteine-containing dehydrogenase
MRRLRLSQTGPMVKSSFRPEFRVLEYFATRRGDAERGPMIRISPTDARIRLLVEGELAWVQGPRRNELAIVEIDENIPDGSLVARDIAGITVSEKVVVTKPDLDSSPKKAG